MVAYTAQGTALYVALTMNKNEKGKDCASMHTWRSENGGETWLPAVEIPCGPSWDHEQMIVDYSKGKYSGRIYIAALYDYPVYRVGVFRSDDDGRTLDRTGRGRQRRRHDRDQRRHADGPVRRHAGRPVRRLPVPARGPQVDGDGERQPLDGVLDRRRRDVLEAARKVGHTEPTTSTTRRLQLAGFGKFAADTESAALPGPDVRRAGRTPGYGRPRILFSRTLDRGKTWSAPKPIDDAIPKAATQWQPAVAVNKDGVVAVTWFDTRDSVSDGKFHQYLAASLDGGDTFLPTVRVSSEASNPKGAGNSPADCRWRSATEGVISLSFISAASRWGSGRRLHGPGRRQGRRLPSRSGPTRARARSRSTRRA